MNWLKQNWVIVGWGAILVVSFALVFYREPGPEEVAAAYPLFEDFPVSEIYRGTPALPDLDSDPLGHAFRTRITEGAKEGPNFAGHYTVAEWGCGSPCNTGAVIDAATGKIYELPTSAVGYEFKLESRLLVSSPLEINRGYDGSVPSWWREAYYEWTGSEFKLLAVYEWNATTRERVLSAGAQGE